MPRGLNLKQMLRKRKKNAPARVSYELGAHGRGVNRPCVIVTCLISGRQAGPVWGHGDTSVRRALAQLTRACDCPARFHQGREFTGEPVAE